jgi:hypothetical protein
MERIVKKTFKCTECGKEIPCITIVHNWWGDSFKPVCCSFHATSNKHEWKEIRMRKKKG